MFRGGLSGNKTAILVHQNSTERNGITYWMFRSVPSKNRPEASPSKVTDETKTARYYGVRSPLVSIA